MSYPAIIYYRDDMRSFDADNIKYHKYNTYSITLIDRNPDSPLLDKIFELPSCNFQRSYNSNNLKHTVFRLVF